MRKELDYTVPDEGRDKGKVFHLTEMSPVRSEKWALRALRAAAKGGANIGEDILTMGVQGVVVTGITSLFSADFEDIEPLLDEMMACITFKPDPRNPQITRPLIEDDIEEVQTLLKLRMEVLKLHTDFFGSANPLTSAPGSSPPPQGSPNMSTSPAQSPPSSRRAARR